MQETKDKAEKTLRDSQSIKQIFAARLNQCFKRTGLRKIAVARKIGLTSGGIGQILSGANFPGVDKMVQGFLAGDLVVDDPHVEGVLPELITITEKAQLDRDEAEKQAELNSLNSQSLN